MDVIQVTLLGMLREPLEDWLSNRGLGLQRLDDEGDMPQYVVVIPEGSPLEARLREIKLHQDPTPADPNRTGDGV